MAGVRIQHPTERSSTFTLVDGSRPYRQPWACPPPPEGCARIHAFKTYHFRLDETGAAIVSIEIWERLQRIPGSQFALANAVERPPDQVVRVPMLKLLARAIQPDRSAHGQEDRPR